MEMVILCVLVALYCVTRWYAVFMVTPSKWSWCCCLCWLPCTALRFDVLCLWWHNPNGVGVVVCVGCPVLRCVLMCCVYGDTIQMQVVKLCVLVALCCVTRWHVVFMVTSFKCSWLLLLFVLFALYWVAFWYPVCMVKPSKWNWWCCMCYLHSSELCVNMLCVWWRHPSGGGVVAFTGCTVLSSVLTSCVHIDTIQLELVVLCVLVALCWFSCWLLVYILHFPLVYIVTPSKWKWLCFLCRLHCAELRGNMLCVCWHHPNGSGVVCAGCSVLSY